jgi:pSer/pThr/pTyr-binding forkhead associated (FHA) protein
MSAILRRFRYLIAGLIFAGLGYGGTTIVTHTATLAPRATAAHKASRFVQPSVVALRTTFSGVVHGARGGILEGGRDVSVDIRCSAFVVDADGFIATAGRCLDLDHATNDLLDRFAEERWAKHPGVGGFKTLAGYQRHARETFSVTSAAHPSHARPDRNVKADVSAAVGARAGTDERSARVLRVRGFRNGDVALVKIAAHDLPALPLAPDDPTQPGTQLFAAGFPAARSSAPIVQQTTFVQTKQVAQGLREGFVLGPAPDEGLVGGPVVDGAGRVTGIASLDHGDAADANLATPVSELRQVLRDEGVANDVGGIGRTYTKTVRAFFAGDRGEALAGAERLLDRHPDDKLIADLRKDVRGLPSPKDWLAKKLGVAGLLGLIGPTSPRAAEAVLGRTRRRRRSRRHDTVTAHVAALVLDDGQRLPITRTTTIGREEADVVLDDPRVSRRHATVSPVGRGLQIEDAGSANGTFVNGATIDGPLALRNGDVVELGSVRLVVALPAGRGDETMMAPVAPEAVLVVRSGPLAGRRHPVSTEAVVGRGDADIVLDDAQVSRRHAAVRWRNGDLEIEDLESKNGTRVNGAVVEGSQRLAHGDVITIGPFALDVEVLRSDSGATVISD